MRFKGLSEQWLGVVLGLAIAIVSLWLAGVGKLVLYIHPRYIWFTVLLCGMAVVWLVWGVVHNQVHERPWRKVTLLSAVAATLCMALVAVMVILPPAALTSTTATGRGINTAVTGQVTEPPALTLSAAAYEQFSLKEWVSLLASVPDPAFYDDKTIHISGFIAPTANSDPDVFYVSRFIVTCCAIDAQPIGVAVYMPHWRDKFAPDQWVQVDGGFTNRLVHGAPTNAVRPEQIQRIEEPKDPYAR